jgi:hypothetical protein
MFRPAIWMYVILLGLAGFLVFEIVQVWSRPAPTGSGPAVSGAREAPQPRPAPEAQATPRSASGGQEPGLKPKEAYQIVSVKNPFRPSRTDWEGAGRHVERPKVYLYGVTLAGDYQAALLAVGPAGKGRGARLYRLGDQVGGYTLKEIGSDRVLLALGDDTFPVLLHDASKPKPLPSPAPAAGPSAPAATATRVPQAPTVTPPADGLRGQDPASLKKRMRTRQLPPSETQERAKP